MSKYIDADLLIRKIRGQIRLENLNFAALGGGGQTFCTNTLEWVLKQISSLQQEQPDKSLEEAADEHYDEMWDELGGFAETRDGCYDIFFPSKAIRDTFIAGAEWQKSRDAFTAAEVGCIVSLDAQLREDYPDRETRHQRIAEIINQDRKTEQR